MRETPQDECSSEVVGTLESNTRPATVLIPSISKSSFWPATVMVALFCLVIGCYFCALQDQYYSHYQPFFDSLGYYDQVHAVMMTGQQKGFAESLVYAFDSGTVFMPYFIASVLSCFIEPTRNIGVWIQVVELALLLISVLFYFRYNKKIDPVPALILLVPFALTTCLYRNNGGMSDFRMDLSLYLTYSISCVWYLIAAETKNKFHFLLLGIAIAVTCLFRATAPIYLILGLGPLALIDLIKSKDKSRMLVGLGIGLVAAVVGSLWFYILQYDRLHYYYFVWNADANAKLTIAESSGHIVFAFKHIGNHFLIWIIGMNVILLLANWKRGENSLLQTAGSLTKDSIRQTDWRLIWLALAPLAMLVLRGAGLNQYVCLPAMFGILLWFINPLANNLKMLTSGPALLAAATVSAICVGLVGFEGWQRHDSGEYNSMLAHQLTIAEIVEDAEREGMQKISYGSTHMFYLNSASLESTMRFDFDDVSFDGRNVFVADKQMIKNGIFSGIVADANWEELSGTTTEKLDSLLVKAHHGLDYVIVPDLPTIDFLEERIAFNIINQHQRYLRKQILESGNWVPVSKMITNGKYERVQVFRNASQERIARRGDVAPNLRQAKIFSATTPSTSVRR